GLAEQAGRAYMVLVGTAVSARRYGLAARHLQAGLDYCSDHGLERDRRYLLASPPRTQLAQGRWREAGESAAAVLRVPRTSVSPRINALVVLGLVRARRGGAGQSGPPREARGAGDAARGRPA